MADQGGRGRGRGRTRGMGPMEPVRRPGDQPQPTQPTMARGRTRGVAVAVAGPSTSHGDEAAIRQVESEVVVSKIGGGLRGMHLESYRGRAASEQQLVTRPTTVLTKTGKSGTPVNLMANYFKVLSTPKCIINHYHVDFKPEIDNPGLRRKLMRVHEKELGKYIFDGSSIFTITRLPDLETEFFSTRENDGAIIQLKVKFVREVPPSDPIVMQILSIQIRKNFRYLGFKQMGRLYYDPEKSTVLRDHNLEFWPGFATAIHQHELDPLLCVDLTYKVMRTDTVLGQMREIYNKNPRYFKDEATKLLVGSIILTRYNNKTYRIDDIDFTMNPLDKFKSHDGSEITFVDYYKKAYNIQIHDVKQPLIISQRKRKNGKDDGGPIILIPEICTMTGISEETRANFNTMKAISTVTKSGPQGRAEAIRGFLERCRAEPKIIEEMANWEMQFSKELVQFSGRVLPPEKIEQGPKDSYTYVQGAADWSREMRSRRLLRPVQIYRWVVITTPRDSQNTSNFVDALLRVGRPMGMAIDPPNIIVLQGDRSSDYLTAFEKVYSRDLTFAMFVFPNNRKDRYDAIKKACCINAPVPSQVILGKTVMKQNMLMSVATKVAIQVNCKLGGAPWFIQIPFQSAMVIGYDSYHDSSMRGKSAGAVCCSINKDFTQYHSNVHFQSTHEELMNGLFVNVLAGLKRYNAINKGLPEKIFIYRDGVGEGQLNMVFEYEVSRILECFKKMGNYNPKLAFIVVTKRLNSRIFLKRNGNVDNPVPGTVVDQVITRPNFYDFFLVSQSVREGTVAPTHYNIIHDTTGISPDIIQKLTYRLTHLYYNWPGTLRVPAPCMYAHKLAFLAGQSLHANPSPDLADSLYFL